MRTEDFDFYLPKEQIAQTPLLNRSSSKMLVLHRDTGLVEHKHFDDIVDYFNKGDVIVRNNTKVIPARLLGTKEGTGAHVEVLLLKDLGNDTWECLTGNARTIKVDTIITFGDGSLKCKCLEVRDEGIRIFKMIYDGIFYEILDTLGQMPLPPYIKEKLEDKDRYQTVYAKVIGSAAAPTAGFHFTNEIFEKLKAKGVEILDITLHVGLGTFRPVEADDINDHHMHSEYYEISDEVANRLNLAKKEGRKITAIGTTSVRTLESNIKKYGCFKGECATTQIFIYPGYEFGAVDHIVTNFHLPKSTLIMLVSAFAGREKVLEVYKEAVDLKYRFFSFGDGMLIL